jgi:hypothetical protein
MGLLSEICSLQAKTGASLFAASQFIPEIVKEFRKAVSLKIRVSEDVQRYLDSHMSWLSSFISRVREL